MTETTIPDLWPELFRRLAARHSRHMLIAEWDGKPIARASLSVHAGTGWLRSMSSIPSSAAVACSVP